MSTRTSVKSALPSNDNALRPLRVAQLITHFSRGGAQATVFNSCLDLPDHVQMTVLAGADDFGEGSFWADAAEANLDVQEVQHLQRSINPLADLRFLIWFTRWLRKTKPDVLHTHSSKAGVLGRLAGCLSQTPVVHTVHGWSFSPYPNGRTRTLLVGLERLLARLSKFLVVVTTYDRSTGIEERIGGAGKYVVVRSGIDLSEPERGSVNKSAAKSALGFAETDFVVGTVARMAQQKKLADLIEGFHQSEIWRDGATLVLIGDGPLRTELEDQVKDLGLRGSVQFVGVRADASFLVAGFDVFALTSAWEGLPRTLIEAMAAQVPVIATPVGGVREVVKPGETGLIVPVSAPSEVGAALAELFADPARGARMAANAALLVSEFSRQEMVLRLTELWSRAGKR